MLQTQFEFEFDKGLNDLQNGIIAITRKFLLNCIVNHWR